MAARSIEEKLATRMFETFARLDFSPEQCAYYLSRCGWQIQQVAFRFVKGLILQWTMDYDAGETKGGSDEYLILTMRARQLQDLIERKDM